MRSDVLSNYGWLFSSWKARWRTVGVIAVADKESQCMAQSEVVQCNHFI